MRRYVQGLLSDSLRKSMEAMLARGTDPGGYQAFQHFITDAPWSADGVWRCLRAVLPEREGLVIFAGTSFPKPGTSSVGVARQYCGAVGKVANGQVAVTAALWTGLRAYLLGAALYVPEAWLTDAARDRARLPRGGRLQAKWRQALTLLRFVNLPATTSWPQLVRLAHQRWAIEQQYQELKPPPRVGSLRRPHVPGLAPSRRAHRRDVQLPAGRAAAAPRRAHLSSGPRDRAGNLHRVPLCSTAVLPEAHRGAKVGAIADLTK